MLDITFKLSDSEQEYTIKNVPTNTTVEQLVSAIQKNYPGKQIVFIKAGGKTVYGNIKDPAAVPLPAIRKVGPAAVSAADGWEDTGTGYYFNRKTHELRLK